MTFGKDFLACCSPPKGPVNLWHGLQVLTTGVNIGFMAMRNTSACRGFWDYVHAEISRTQALDQRVVNNSLYSGPDWTFSNNESIIPCQPTPIFSSVWFWITWKCGFTKNGYSPIRSTRSTRLCFSWLSPWKWCCILLPSIPGNHSISRSRTWRVRLAVGSLAKPDLGLVNGFLRAAAWSHCGASCEFLNWQGQEKDNERKNNS